VSDFVYTTKRSFHTQTDLLCVLLDDSYCLYCIPFFFYFNLYFGQQQSGKKRENNSIDKHLSNRCLSFFFLLSLSSPLVSFNPSSWWRTSEHYSSFSHIRFYHQYITGRFFSSFHSWHRHDKKKWHITHNYHQDKQIIYFIFL
jgi:uncharacterized membrane protein